jgi:DNA-binding MarR family transcriptional regulator
VEDLKQLFSDLIRFENELWRGVDARLRSEHDLPLHRFEPMQVIADTPGCRVHDIVGALTVTTGGASKLVDSLEVSGYCRRRPNPEDRRSSIIELTPVGRKLFAKASTTVEHELRERLGSAMPKRTLDQLGTTLRGLRRDAAARAA